MPYLVVLFNCKCPHNINFMPLEVTRIKITSKSLKAIRARDLIWIKFLQEDSLSEIRKTLPADKNELIIFKISKLPETEIEYRGIIELLKSYVIAIDILKVLTKILDELKLIHFRFFNAVTIYKKVLMSEILLTETLEELSLITQKGNISNESELNKKLNEILEVIDGREKTIRSYIKAKESEFQWYLGVMNILFFIIGLLVGIFLK